MKHLRKVYSIVFQHWGLLLLGLVTMVIYAVMQGFSITVLVPLFDYVLVPNKEAVLYTTLPQFTQALWGLVQQYNATHGGWGAWLDFEHLKPLWADTQQLLAHADALMLLYSLCGLVVALIVLKNIFFYIYGVSFARLSAYTIYELRSRLFRRYMVQSLSFFQTNRVGDSLVRMVSDVDIVSKHFINNLFASLGDIFTIIVAGRIAIMLNPRLFLWTVAFLPIITLAVSVIGGKIKKYARRMQTQASSMYSNVEEILNSMPVVKAFTREKYEIKRFDVINRTYSRFWRKAEQYHILTQPISEVNSTVVGVFMLVIGGQLIIGSDGAFSLGNFTAFLFAIFSMLHPTKKLVRLYTNIRKAMVSLDRIAVVMDRAPEIEDSPRAVAKQDFAEAIELHDVRFAYEQNAEVLHGVNLRIAKGEKVGLVGSSGSGKTTLVNLIDRMYDATGGSIAIDGVNVKDIKLEDLHALFGVVTQDSILFSDTVAGNIRYGTHREVDDAMLHTAARVANADEFIEKLPEGYHTMLKTKGGGLSGGQRQRLCIARAIVGDPPILIFDEATSALDTEAERKVQQAIEQATRNRTVIMIAHRLSTILSCDTIVVMDKGRIIDMGKHRELLERCATYRRLYELQFETPVNGEEAAE